MTGESPEARKTSFPLVLGSVVIVLIVIVGAGVWGLREVYSRAKESQMVGLIAHTWMSTNPQILGELGPISTTAGSVDAPEEHPGHRTAHGRYHAMGSKRSGDLDFWMRQFPGSSWTVTGAVLTTSDRRTIRIGSPPDSAAVNGSRN